MPEWYIIRYLSIIWFLLTSGIDLCVEQHNLLFAFFFSSLNSHYVSVYLVFFLLDLCLLLVTSGMQVYLFYFVDCWFFHRVIYPSLEPMNKKKLTNEIVFSASSTHFRCQRFFFLPLTITQLVTLKSERQKKHPISIDYTFMKKSADRKVSSHKMVKMSFKPTEQQHCGRSTLTTFGNKSWFGQAATSTIFSYLKFTYKVQMTKNRGKIHNRNIECMAEEMAEETHIYSVFNILFA